MIRCFLFFDDWMIDDIRDVERCFGSPQPEGPLITGDFGKQMRTVEMPGDQWPTKWRMWYANPPDPEDRSEPGRNPQEYFCLAESDDGFEWRSVHLPMEERPYKEYPNAAFEHGAKEVRYDPWDIPERRYKAGFNVRALHEKKAWHNMIMGWSADGVHWDHFDNPDYAYFTRAGGSDGTRTPFYSPITKQWHMVIRPYCPDRRVAVTSSPDLKNWTDVYTMMQPDCLDPPGTQFYGLRVWPYGVTNGCGTPEDFEGYFVGCLHIFRSAMGERCGSGKWTGHLHDELAYSTNGLFWNRTHRQSLFRQFEHGEPGGGWFDYFIIGYDEDERLRLAVRKWTQTHMLRTPEDYTPGPGGWQHHILRKDGFVFLRSIGTGRFGMKGMRPAKGDLNINFKAPYGRIRVQASDLHFNPIEGFTFDDCVPLQGDELHAPVRWKSKTSQDLVDMGQSCRLEFEMFEANIYAVRWTCEYLDYADQPVYDLR